MHTAYRNLTISCFFDRTVSQYAIAALVDQIK